MKFHFISSTCTGPKFEIIEQTDEASVTVELRLSRSAVRGVPAPRRPREASVLVTRWRSLLALLSSSLLTVLQRAFGMATISGEETSLLEKLDQAVPPLSQFDAFPKLPSTYKARSESRGFMTLFVSLLAFLLMLNDIGEFIWGWPDYEFSVDRDTSSFMNINVDLVVNMPCRRRSPCFDLFNSFNLCLSDLSVDLRDAIGDRLFLSGSGLKRDGVRYVLLIHILGMRLNNGLDTLRYRSGYQTQVCLCMLITWLFCSTVS